VLQHISISCFIRIDAVLPSHITGMQGVSLPCVEPYIRPGSPAYNIEGTDAVYYASSLYKTISTVPQGFQALSTGSSQNLGCQTLINEAQQLAVTEHRQNTSLRRSAAILYHRHHRLREVVCSGRIRTPVER
jgi:hypothetical protein